MKVQEFMSLLFEVEVNAHIMHLQTTSFAQHKALNKLYEDIVSLRDRFAESYQGEYDIIKNYQNINVYEGKDPVVYIQEVCDKIHTFHSTLTEPYLQAIVEDIQEFLYSTKYLLKNLS